jgi:hypothetical protein
MRIPIDPVSLPYARYVLRDLNIQPVEAQLPVIGGTQYVDLNTNSGIEIANVLTRLKHLGVIILWNLVATQPPDEIPMPIPSLTALNPASAPHNTGLTLTAVGANFIPGCEIGFGGKPRPTTFIDSGHLSTSLSKQDITPPGSYLVRVRNPEGDLSNPLPFTST